MPASRISKMYKTLGRILPIILIAAVIFVPQSMPNLRAASLDGPYWAYLPAVLQASAEWKLHKTDDGLHPDGNEQQMMWLMNRARSNPTQEGIWLATTNDSNIARPRDYFGVDVVLLQSEFASIAVRPPAAFDVRLYRAAEAHSEYLISIDGQGHTGQFDRVKAEGFVYRYIRGNVFSYSNNSVYAHAAFNIDWDGPNDGDGMQDSRGHRKAIMSIDNDYYSNVGIAMVPEQDPNTNVGPLVTTGNYANPNTSTANHYHRFIVGTVWQDRNGNAMYDPGEGYGNVTVNIYPGSFYAVTAVGGGYAIPILSPGTYTVVFSGAVNGQTQVAVGEKSVLVDWKAPASSTAPLETAFETEAPLEEYITPPPGISE